MGFYDNPLVIRGDGWGDLTSGGNQLYTRNELNNLSEQYSRDNGAEGNPYLKQLNYENSAYTVPKNETGNFYTDPNTGNIYTNKQIDFENGQVTYDPYLNIEDLSNDAYMPYLRQSVFNNSPSQLKSLVDLRNSNPQAYQQQAASGIADMGFNLWQGNSPYASELTSQLEKIKDVNPAAYYNADIALKAKQMGHNAANGAPDRNAPMQQDIQNMYSNAINSGLSPQYIDSIINQNFQNTAANRSKTNAANKASGGAGFNFKTDMLPGLKLVGSALLGAYGADYLSAAEAASAAEGASAASTADILGSTGFTPVDGASFAIDPNATYTTAGLGSNAGAANISSNPVTQSMIDFANASPDPIQAMAEMQNMTPSELANALGPGAGAGVANLTGKEVLDYIRGASQVIGAAGTLSKLLGGSGGTGTGTGPGLSTAQMTASLAAEKGTNPAAASSSTFADLKPGLTKGSAFKFANTPTFSEQVNPVQQQNMPDYTSQILNAAQGGLVHHFSEGGQTPEMPASPSPTLRPGLTRGSVFKPMTHYSGMQFAGYRPRAFAEGGDVEQDHNPQFYSEGGLNTLDNTYVKGEGDGTSDSVPAMLANGEFVIPADVVSKLGNGSNDSGADVLSQFLATIREHAQNHDPKELPPESKGALAYLLDAKRKVG